MDKQSQQPTATTPTTNPQLAVPPAPAATVANPPGKPRIDISDDEAQALLAVNNLRGRQPPKNKPPLKLLIAVLSFIVVAVLISFLLGAYKPGGSSKSSNSAGGFGVPNQANPTSGNGVSNQVNQDVQACSNPVNAVTVC